MTSFCLVQACSYGMVHSEGFGCQLWHGPFKDLAHFLSLVTVVGSLHDNCKVLFVCPESTFIGTVCGVIAKFSPFLSSDISLSCSLPEIFTTHFFFNSFTSMSASPLFSFCSYFRLISFIEPIHYVVRLLGTIRLSDRPQCSTYCFVLVFADHRGGCLDISS